MENFYSDLLREKLCPFRQVHLTHATLAEGPDNAERADHWRDLPLGLACWIIERHESLAKWNGKNEDEAGNAILAASERVTPQAAELLHKYIIDLKIYRTG